MSRPTFTWRSSIFSTSNSASPYTATTAWTPAANSLIVAFVCNTATSPADPTGVTAHGVTLDKVRGGLVVSTNNNISVWVGNAGASPTNAAASASVGGTPTGCSVVEFEVTNWNTSGTALQAVLLTATATGASGTTGTVPIPLDAQTVNESAWLSFFNHLTNETTTGQGGNWTATAGGTGNYTSTASASCGQHNNTGYTATATATWATSSAWLGLVIEIQGTTADEPKEAGKVADTVTGLLLNPLRAEPAVEALKVGTTADSQVSITLGPWLRIQDTVTAALLGGAADLTRAVADEPLKLADTVTVLLNPLQTLPAESLKVQDSVTVLENPLQASPSEAGKLADTVTTVLDPLLAAPLTEAGKLADTVTVLENPLVAVPAAEALKVQDLVLTGGDLLVTVTPEAGKLADTVTPSLNPLFAAPVAEAVKVGTTTSSRVDLYGPGAWLKVQDTVTAALVSGSGVLVDQEGLKLADTVTAVLNPLIAVTATEAIRLSDLDAANWAELTKDEYLTLTDTVTAALTGALLAAPPLEPVKLADTVTVSLNPLIVTVGGEALTVQDTVTPALQLAVALADEPLKLADPVIPSLTVLLVSGIDELVHVQDLVATGNDLVVQVTEPLKLADTATVLENPFFVTVSGEALKVQDTLLATLGGLVVGAADEPLKLADSVLAVLLNPLQASASESVRVADLITPTEDPLQTSTPAESLKVQDVVTPALQLATTGTAEALKLADPVTVSLGLDAGQLTESCRITDTVTARLTTLVVGVTESLKVQDSLVVFGDLLSVYVADEVVHVQDFAYATPAVAVVTIQVQPRPSVIQVQPRPNTIQVTE